MKDVKLCLVCSSGGHLQQLYKLKDFWSRYNRVWITFSGKHVNRVLDGEEVLAAYHPTNRNILNLVRNLFLAVKILKKYKPDYVISTGAGVCVPFFLVGKIFGSKLIYIESLTRIHKLSLSGRIIYPISNYFIVQWPQLSEKYKKAIFKGRVI